MARFVVLMLLLGAVSACRPKPPADPLEGCCGAEAVRSCDVELEDLLVDPEGHDGCRVRFRAWARVQRGDVFLFRSPEQAVHWVDTSSIRMSHPGPSDIRKLTPPGGYAVIDGTFSDPGENGWGGRRGVVKGR